jgi:hypothetical protein
VGHVRGSGYGGGCQGSHTAIVLRPGIAAQLFPES